MAKGGLRAQGLEEADTTGQRGLYNTQQQGKSNQTEEVSYRMSSPKNYSSSKVKDQVRIWFTKKMVQVVYILNPQTKPQSSPRPLEFLFCVLSCSFWERVSFILMRGTQPIGCKHIILLKLTLILWPLPPKCWHYSCLPASLFSALLGMEPRVVCILGKHSIYWVQCQALLLGFVIEY